MKICKVWLLVVLPCIPAAAFAGFAGGRAVPTLGEIGLATLGLSLVGGGAFALRRRKR